MKTKRYNSMMLPLLLALAGAMLVPPASLTSAGQTPVWRVWMKTSPCSGRTDWVSVAKENPTTGGGGAYFEIFPGSRTWATFAEAMAEANALRGSSLFSNYCCREYSVWQNNQTGKFTVVQGKFGNPGFGWQFVKGNLCCDEAFAQAGLSSSCGGGGGAASTCFAQDPGMASTNRNDHYDWAQRQDAARLEANLKTKIDVLFNCPVVNSDHLSSVFADASVIIARYVPQAACFRNDPGAVSTDYGAHQAWARPLDRRLVLNNLQWKVASALKCLDRARQASFFADLSVAIAKGAGGGGVIASGGGSGGSGGVGRGGSGGSGGSGGGTGGNSGGSGSGGGAVGPGSLKLVEVIPTPNHWGNDFSVNPNGGQITAKWSYGNANYQWNNPPQQVGPEGFTITLNATAQAVPRSRVTTGLTIKGGGFELDPATATFGIDTDKGNPASGSLTVRVKPPRNPSGDYYLEIGVNYYLGFKYHYRAVR